MYEGKKRKFKDRKDGFLVRNVTPLFMIIPFLMKKRDDSQVFYEFDADITKTETVLRDQRKESYKGLSYTHLVMAAAARAYAENPRMNRFVAGRRVYARNCLKFSLAAKTEISKEAEELLLVTEVDPKDDIFEIAAKFDEQYQVVISARQKKESKKKGHNATDILVKFFRHFPRFLLKAVVGIAEFLDYHGLLPLRLENALPFYSSAFITNIGSLGADAIYHHLYNFGTTTLFVGFGNKKTVYELRADGTVEKKYKMTFRVVIDERICDGSAFIMAMKDFKYYIENPSKLLERGTVDLIDPDL